jgi:hypothetical protein
VIYLVYRPRGNGTKVHEGHIKASSLEDAARALKTKVLRKYRGNAALLKNGEYIEELPKMERGGWMRKSWRFLNKVASWM